MQKDKKILVVANGDKDLSFLQAIYVDYDLIIAADGASNVLYEADIRPDILVGDFDSIEEDVLHKYEEQGVRLVRLKPEKDFSDTHIAIDTAIEEGASQIDLAGGFGGRWDHSIANLNLLYYCYEKKIGLSLISRDNYASLKGPGQYDFPHKEDFYFSFFSLFEDAVLSLENMKYELEDRLVKRGESIGLSNEYLADAKLRISQGSILLIESRKEECNSERK